MVSGLTRNQMPRKGLRVRIPCPPLVKTCVTMSYASILLPQGTTRKSGKFPCYAGATVTRFRSTGTAGELEPDAVVLRAPAVVRRPIFWASQNRRYSIVGRSPQMLLFAAKGTPPR
jgi:hypothetical protein